MNFWDICILVLVSAAVFFALRKIFRDKKNGKCCGNCKLCRGCNSSKCKTFPSNSPNSFSSKFSQK
ncbi:MULTISPECIES: FeoB-associated Cys-rich membrane protein [Hallerella]|uniref:FeoB-associated Cys-rich membrane protein n=1 Tax=Hallerella TaxID=2815788 RepID=UPI000D083F15